MSLLPLITRSHLLAKQNRISPWYQFVSHVPKYQNDLCIWSREKRYTWQETHDLAAQWAQYFLSHGVKPGDMVGTYLMNSADFLVIWLGLWCIGCAPAMLNYNLKGESLIHCLKVSDVRLVLVDSDPDCRARFDGVKDEIESSLGVRSVCVDEALLRDISSSKIQVPDDEYRSKVDGPSPSCLLYTSGTTGLPKAGVFHMQRFHERGNPTDLPFDQQPGPDGDRWYCCMPLFHGTGGMACMSTLTGGMSVAVGRKFSVRTFWNDIHDSSSTIFVYVGETARYLLMAPTHPLERDHPRLRAMFGNGMRPDVWTRFQTRFSVPEVIEFFNSTEGVLRNVIHSKGPFTANCVGQFGLLLRTIYSKIYIPVPIDPETGSILRDPKTGFVKRNSYTEGGEILVNVPAESAFAGYYNNPSATAKKFERNVFKKGDLYYRSGDALRRDGDGRWFFLDRLGDTYRWKSENVSTAEVAEVLGAYPGISEAIVYGVLVPNHDGRAGCAALRFAEGVDPETFDWGKFLAYARSKLPRYGVPVFVRLLVGGRGEGERNGERTHNNKQNKAPLREEGIELERYGERVEGGEGDRVLWVGMGGEGYTEFTKEGLDRVRRGEARL